MKRLKLNSQTGKPLLVGVVAIVVILCLVWIAKVLHFRLNHVMSDDARVDGKVMSLSSRVSGWVTHMAVIEGDPVRIGQVLATIDDRETRLKRAAFAAQLDSIQQQRHAQEAEIEQTEASTHGDLDNAEGKLAAVTASRESIRQRLEQVRADYRRNEELAAKHFLSPQVLELARSNLLQAEAELRRAEAEIVASRGALAAAKGQRNKVGVLRAKLHANSADTDQIRAQIAALDAELEDRTIKSPVDGAVVMTFVREREYVSAGQRLMMVHNPQDQWIEANVKETDIALVQVGQPVEITASAYPDMLFHGKVARVGGAATSKFALLPDPNPSGNFTKITQRFPVRIVLDQPAPALRPGMMVEVAIDHGSR